MGEQITPEAIYGMARLVLEDYRMPDFNFNDPNVFVYDPGSFSSAGTSASASGTVPVPFNGTVRVNNVINTTTVPGFPGQQLTLFPSNPQEPVRVQFVPIAQAPNYVQVEPGDMVYGCYNCHVLRPGPVSFSRTGRPPNGMFTNKWGATNTLPPSGGYCHECGNPLQEVTCACGEPLHQNEKRCRHCANDMKPFHQMWGTWWEPATEEELAARGNVDDDGTFRGEREV